MGGSDGPGLKPAGAAQTRMAPSAMPRNSLAERRRCLNVEMMAFSRGILGTEDRRGFGTECSWIGEAKRPAIDLLASIPRRRYNSGMTICNSLRPLVLSSALALAIWGSAASAQAADTKPL